MKIKIKNFGPIHSFEFDLDKDFHVIYGKNNIGKSYAISVVYLILKEMSEFDYYLFSEDAMFSEFSKKIGEKIKSDKISIKKDFEELISQYLSEKFLVKLQGAFKNTFPDLASIGNKLSKENLLISIILKTVTIDISVNVNGVFVVSNVNIGSDMTGENGRVTSILFGKMELPFSERNDYTYVLVNLVLGSNFTIKNKIFFLPASRSGLYQGMNIFSSVFAMLSQMRHGINQKIEIPALPIPVSDYFLGISTIKQQQSKDVYHSLATEIEDKILDARIQFNHETKKLEYYSEKMDLRLDLSQVSSMISEVAPIVAYLKYVINESEEEGFPILFIEEPEAHLHPEIQVLLTEIFAKLSKNKAKIVMTTHSNYLFNKVNNMILKKELSLDKVANYHIINTPKGSIIDPDTEATAEGIEDKNFVITAEKLYHERLEALDDEQ